MPIISALGAMSSRGFGEFSQQTQANYIENYFSTYLYDGNGGNQTINNGVSLENTSAWTSYKIQQNSSRGQSINTDSSGNVYVTGRANDGSNYIIIAKYNSAGSLQWQRKLQQGSSAGYGIAVDSSGNVYVTGTAVDGAFNYAIVAKYNSSGSLQWQRKLQQTNDGSGYGIAVDSSGNVYVTGYSSDGSYYIIVAKYNSSGTIQWQRKLRQNFSLGQSITIDTSSNIYVTGGANDGSDYIIVAKYDSSGAIQWQRKLRQGNSYGYGITTDSSNNVYVTGYANDGSIYAIVAKYNSSGSLQWQRKIKSVAYGYAITTDASNNIYVAGAAYDNVNYYIILSKYDSSGTIQWQRKLQQNGSYGYGVATDTSGNVYIIGYANDGTEDYNVITKLAQDGSTTSGNAFVSMITNLATDSAAGATDSAGAATDGAGTATESAAGATDSAGTATTSMATQDAVTNAGGLVWIKMRSSTSSQYLVDTVRGYNKGLSSNTTGDQFDTANSYLTSFNANGFSIAGSAVVNQSSQIYASWTFAKKSKFFDIVSYTGNGTNRTISHNLGSVPGMIIIKRTDTTGAWAVYHSALANTEYLILNTTAAKATGATYWNSTTPTSTVFSLGTATDVNANGGTYVAYLYASNAGGFGADGSQNVISCGSFTSDGSGNASVTLGYEPQFVLVKGSSNTGNWYIIDNMRGFGYSTSPSLSPNVTDEEYGFGTSAFPFAPTATGFSATGNFGASRTYIYMAIRRGPMATPTDATKVFMPTVYTGTNVDNRLVDTTIAPDTVWVRQRNDTVLGGMVVGDRLRGQPYLLTGTTAAEVTAADAFDAQIVSTTEYGTAFSSMNGFWCGNNVTAKLNTSTTASNQIAEAFKRAPGFFDISCFTSTGSFPQTVYHNLGVAPELVIIKRRNQGTEPWYVGSLFTPTTCLQVFLNQSTSGTIDTYANIGTFLSAPTSTSMDVNMGVSAGVTIVSYLFASCPGVSKVGSYTGTGTTQQINCGFTAGARFVLIKRTDTTGDWYVYDSARGIVAGNDPYILLNSTAAEVTSTDYVDTYSAGFELSSTAPAGLNEASGITWTSRTSGFSGTIYDLAYGNGLFVAVGAGGQLTTSSDGGVTWTARTSSFGATNIYTVTYGNGTFVAAGDSGKLATSPDGITWTQRTSGFGSSSIDGCGYGNGLFVIVGPGGLLSTSPDGITWTSRTSSFGASDINCVAYGNGLYVAGGDAKIATSTDGITWTQRTSPFGGGYVADIAYGNNLYVAVSGLGPNNIATSSDGISWTLRSSGVSQVFYFAAYGNGIYMAGGSNGSVVTSTDGITWVDRTATVGFGNVIETATYGNGTFVIGGRVSKISTNSPSYLYLAIA